jgi:ABC-type nitrate/sulfonate/bicarbonate transport system substrate-binding protein
MLDNVIVSASVTVWVGSGASSLDCMVRRSEGMFKRHRYRTISISIAVATALYTMSANAEPITIRLGFNEASARLFQSLGLYVAEERGFLKSQNIQLDIKMLGGSYHQVDELDKGHVDITYVAVNDMVPQIVAGSDAVAIVGGPRNPVYSLVAKPGITSVNELTGKPVAVSLPADIISIATDDIFASHHAGTYQPVALLGTVNRVECLKSGDCEAAMLSQPFDIELIGSGYNVVATSHDVYPELQYTVYAAERKWADAHQDTVRRFTRAIGEAYKYISDPVNKSDIISMATEKTGQSKEVIEKLYAEDFEPYNGVLPQHGEISLNGFQKVLDLMHRAGDITEAMKADRFIDLRYLQEEKLEK